MNYLKIYVRLVRKALIRNWNKKSAPTYVEAHHVFPVSIFGSNKKIVYLTVKEHYIAHALLYKGLNKRYGMEDPRVRKMQYALWQMSNTRKYYNSRLYETLRTEFSKTQSKRIYSEEQRLKISKKYTGKGNPRWGKPCSKATKEKISATLRNKSPWESSSAKTNISVWKKAQELYILWLENNKPGAARLAKRTEFTFSNLNYIHKNSNLDGYRVLMKSI